MFSKNGQYSASASCGRFARTDTDLYTPPSYGSIEVQYLENRLLEKMPRKLRFFSVLLLVPLLSLYARAESFEDRKYNFTLWYPDDFVPVPVEITNLALALKSKDSNFPTFNVVVSPGGFEEKPSLKAQEKALIDEYRAVGIIEPSILTSTFREANGARVFNAEIGYYLSGEKMIADVAIVNGGDRHFTLTFIDTAVGFRTSNMLPRQILNSFTVLESPLVVQSEPEESPREQWQWSASTLFLIGGSVVLLAALFYSRRLN